jgi:hypothetical protein
MRRDFYHGGVGDLPVGGLLLPPRETGYPNRRGSARKRIDQFGLPYPLAPLPRFCFSTRGPVVRSRSENSSRNISAER